MRKGFVILIAAGAAVAAYGAALKVQRTENNGARINRELRSLNKRVDDLEDAVELLDTRTDGMEYDMKYNVERVSDFSSLYDIDVDDERY